MNTAKTEKKEIQETKPNNEQFPDFNGRLDLVLKLICILINLSISEGNLSDLDKKKELIKKYDDMFKAAKNGFCINLQRIMYKDFLNDMIKNFTCFDKNLLPFIRNALSCYNNFLLNKINVDKLMDELIALFSKSISYVKMNKGKSYSFDLTNEFYYYLDDISKRAKDLKHLTSKKKSKDEEIKVQEKAESESEYFFKIEELKKLLEEKENELNSANQQFMSLSLDLGTYKEINEHLTKNINEIKNTSNNIIERKNKEIDDYKSILNRIEQKLEETLKESKESKKKTDEKLSEYSNLIAQNSLKISNLSQKIIVLEKSNSLLKKENQELKKTIQQFENEIKSLKIKFEQSTKERNEILKIFTQKWRELQLYIMDLEDGNAFLLDRYNELANSVYQFIIDYQIRNANSINEVDQDLYYYNYLNKKK